MLVSFQRQLTQKFHPFEQTERHFVTPNYSYRSYSYLACLRTNWCVSGGCSVKVMDFSGLLPPSVLSVKTKPEARQNPATPLRPTDFLAKRELLFSRVNRWNRREKRFILSAIVVYFYIFVCVYLHGLH